MQVVEAFNDHAQDINQEIAPRVSACLSLDTRFQELTRQAMSNCSEHIPGSNIDSTQELEFSDIVQELHQNLDEKIALAKKMLTFLRSRSSQMSRELQTLQKKTSDSSSNSSCQLTQSESSPNYVKNKCSQKSSSSESKQFKNLKKKILASQKQRQPVANSRVLKNKLLRLKKQKSNNSSKALESVMGAENEEKSVFVKVDQSESRKRVNIGKKNMKLSKSNLQQHRKVLKQKAADHVDERKCDDETQSNESVKESDDDSKMDVDEVTKSSDAASANEPNPVNVEAEERDSNSNGELNDSQSQTSPSQYCICNEPFNGDMIACDGESCKVEWFHFRCVGMKAAPKGRWFCDECCKLRNIRQTPKRLAKKMNQY